MWNRLPRLPHLLLRSLLPRDTRDSVIDDLEEIWNERRRQSGRWASSRWLWAQVVQGIGAVENSWVVTGCRPVAQMTAAAGISSQ